MTPVFYYFFKGKNPVDKFSLSYLLLKGVSSGADMTESEKLWIGSFYAAGNKYAALITK
jgi:hypothetical protein